MDQHAGRIRGARPDRPTFPTSEAFAVIKSELVDRISVQNPLLYRQDAEKLARHIDCANPHGT